MSAHRYWRIANIITDGSVSNTSIRELEFRSTSGVSEHPSGGTMLSGGSGSDLSSASNAFDNNSSTYWQRSTIFDGYIGYDYGVGNTKDVAEVAITSWIANECIKYAVIQYSDNGTDWFTYYNISSTSWADNEQRVFLIYVDSPDIPLYVPSLDTSAFDSDDSDFQVTPLFDDSITLDLQTETKILYAFGKHNLHITEPVSAYYVKISTPI